MASMPNWIAGLKRAGGNSALSFIPPQGPALMTEQMGQDKSEDASGFTE